MTFCQALERHSTTGLTANGAVTYTSSLSACMDFFAQAGAMRGRESEALALFKAAYAENKQTAVRTLFYLRDVRGGQGEKSVFLACLNWLWQTMPIQAGHLLPLVPEFGSWKDLVKLFATADGGIKRLIATHLYVQLMHDHKDPNPTLLAKWLPTINASSKNTRQAAHRLVKEMGTLTPARYRQLVRDVRKRIQTVEEKMSAGLWEEIPYDKVPSRAAMLYRKAFKRHDGDRYDAYLAAVKSGEKKINAGTLFPYEIYSRAIGSQEDATLEALWDSLPDYTGGKRAIVVADVSGSMAGLPISVSVSLALYFAERNKGVFKDAFITFSEKPQLQKVNGESLQEKLLSIRDTAWGMNTNLIAVFDLILDSAIQNDLRQSDMPETLYIISDMEFDSAVNSSGLTTFEVVRDKYEQYGFNVPNLVFWNVNASGKNVPVRKNQRGVTLVSGCSPSIFKIAVEEKTPEEVMLDTVNGPRYVGITI